MAAGFQYFSVVMRLALLAGFPAALGGGGGGQSEFGEPGASPPLRLGTIELLFTKTEMLIARRGAGERWRVDLTRLVRGIDCAQRFSGVDHDRCPGLLTAPCPKCPSQIPNVVAWDEVHQSLYFAVTSSLSWEKAFQVFRYSLPSRRWSRLVNTSAAGFDGRGLVSGNGRYLAYDLIHHSAPAAGCVSRGDLEVVDLWTFRSAKPKLAWPQAGRTDAASEVAVLDRIEWSPLAVAKLRYTISHNDERTCDAIPGKAPIRGEIEASGLEFR